MIKVGVIGAGKWGINHIRVFSELDCELVGLADVDKNKKEIADKYKIRFFRDYKKLLPLVDALSVVVPTNLHYNIVKDCLNANKHVLVEKPITNDSKSARELVNLAKEKNLILAVGYLFRFNNAVNKLKREIKNIGKIHYITARYIHLNKPPRKDSGVIFNFGIHLVDILNYILDKKPVSVSCKKINYLSKKREDCAIMILDYNSFIANLEMTWFHPLKKRDLWIIGSEKKIYADLLNQEIIEYPVKSSYKKNLRPPINIKIKKNEPLKSELKEFCKSIDSIVRNKNVKFKGEEELLTTKICELSLLSAKLGKEVIINE